MRCAAASAGPGSRLSLDDTATAVLALIDCQASNARRSVIVMSEAEQRLRGLLRQLLDCPDEARAVELVVEMRPAIHEIVQAIRGQLGLADDAVSRAA